MIHNKFRYLLTLVALFAMTTGAWATVYTSEVDSKVVKVGDILAGGVSLLPPSYVGECDLILGLGRFRSNKVEYTLDHQVYCGAINSIGENAVILMNGAAPETFTPVDENGQDGNAWLVTGISGDGQNFIEIGVCGTYYDPNYDPSAIKVDWNKTSKTGTFTMPGGNVTLEPEYYPQAALTAQPTAINDVPATTDGAIVKAGTVANIGSTETAQGTVMYYVSTTALDDAALLALAADAWTADVPTAADLAQGQAYVYYYVRGNDSDTDEENFSDGDILAANALTVTIAAEPTYAVTFAEGTDPNEWSASPNADVKKGQTVTVTYTGTKKVIGVKAEKKAATPATPAETTVTWNSENISFLQLYEPSAPFTMMGIKLSTSSMSNTADWRNIGIPTNDGLYFDVTTTGGYTFTAPSGKKFTKIEMTVTNANGWTQALFQNTLGTGWPSGEDAVTVVEDTKKVTWTGTAASTVGLLTDASYFNASPVTSIVFTLADAE